MEFWKILNKEKELPKEINQNDFNILYNEYFEKINNIHAIFMLREHLKLQKEYYVLELINCFIDSYNLLIKIPDVKTQEILKCEFVSGLKSKFRMIKIGVDCTFEQLRELLVSLISEQQTKISSLQKENNENESISIYKLIANISISIGMKLNPTEISVAEFIEYYKIAEENGK